MESALYIVPTPIGNRDDITKRAIDVLNAATLIAAEDTRHSRSLLDMLGIGHKKMISCHDHNEQERASMIIDEVQSGGVVALVSDAGTPLISDPGYKVVSICTKGGIKIIPLPGACAAICALSASGLPTDRFLFRGFLPVKNKELGETLLDIKAQSVTVIVYESPRRIKDTLTVIHELMPDRPLCVAREISKLFETFYRGTACQILEVLNSSDNHVKGEFVLMFGPDKEQSVDDLTDSIKNSVAELMPFVPAKLLSKVISDISGVNKKSLYNFIIENKDGNKS
ncbi:Ribosomal RNA small subunit methyltransferase I [Anaerobiospirillum thomasii]|uniref:16S rRNA (cytidine(1402)-2'-O)-methyltransferase n=1 Tax=Anaerobiospirillum thomasii TaxID=179995 RepID=UPI000D972FDA|nr:16S rRNA (cytidine(1402)-2'-O)-methyltransferase [Anaerobiospirillum thomasii]SPT72041.1 Ribosomal RNA small subunit methyltransferase I [Anaerobiospirillum thomasii]